MASKTSSCIVRFLPKQPLEYFQFVYSNECLRQLTVFERYRWKIWEYRGKANNLGIVPKDSIGKDQDIVLKDWLRETFEAKHDRTRLWLTVGGAVIGALFSVNKESESKYSGPWECTFMGTIGAIGGAGAGFLAHLTIPGLSFGLIVSFLIGLEVVGVMIGIHQISKVMVNRQKSIREAEEAVQKVQRHNNNLKRYTEYVANIKDGEKILQFGQWKLIHCSSSDY